MAREMERNGLEIPLLIGGATTSQIHTAVKIEQGYSGSTIHVLDASKAVTVASSLLNKNKADDFVAQKRREYKLMREQHAKKRSKKEFVSIEAARKNKTQITWDKNDIYKPSFVGTKVLDAYPLDEIRGYIDWTPFFATWELAGKYPAILKDEIVGEEATSLFEDAQALLDQIVEENWLTARAVVGIWPANSVGDDIEIYTNETREEVEATFHTLRQQFKKAKDLPNIALADFTAPKETKLADYIGGFAVTAGLGIEKWIKKFEEDHDDYNSILLKALADRLAEAFAELMHQKMRREYWSYASSEELVNEDLIREKYQGIRPAPGYPACPDHTEKRNLFELLDVENKIGVSLTDSYAMYPAASVSGMYYAHPDAKYFGLGKIEKDQVEDYAARKGFSVEEIERWLSPNLNYDPT
jgi:5-methyltetrahydrofolate--homocysteine methyltransferase